MKKNSEYDMPDEYLYMLLVTVSDALLLYLHSVVDILYVNNAAVSCFTRCLETVRQIGSH
jgi:hypothetical protein